MNAELRRRSLAGHGKTVGFVLALGVLGGVFYGVGQAVGPVAPESRPGWHYPSDDPSHGHAR